MTDSFQGGSFEPERSEDYVAPLINSYKEINEGMNNYWSQELSNYKNAAQDAGKDMMLLANMSGTLGISSNKKKKKNEKRTLLKVMSGIMKTVLVTKSLMLIETLKLVL